MNEQDQIKIAKIMEDLEAAQKTTYRVLTELGTVNGFGDQWEELQDIPHQIKAVWNSIDARKGQLIQESRPKGPSGGSQPNLPNLE